MKKTIWIYHKAYNGAIYACGLNEGKPIPDDVQIFNSRNEAEEYACSGECEWVGGKRTSKNFQYIKEKEIEV